MNKITRSTQIFFQNEKNNGNLTVCSKCDKCQNVIDHVCRPGINLNTPPNEETNNLVRTNNGFICKICEDHVPHSC